MHLSLYCDGGNLGKNPSVGVYWSVAREHPDGRIELLTERAVSSTHSTNNHAEYLGLQDALSHAARIPGVTAVTVHSDSQLIVHQFNGRWGINDEQLRSMCTQAQRSAAFLIDGGVKVDVVWVRREENVRRLGH